MTMEESGITVPVRRADHYVHEDGFDPKDGTGIQALDADRLSVLLDQQVVGRVTLAAHGPDPLDAYGYEFDLEPQAALRLAEALSEAARDAATSLGRDVDR
jgi:hypothetical protein